MTTDDNNSRLPSSLSTKGERRDDAGFDTEWHELVGTSWSDDPSLFDGVILRRILAYMIDVAILSIASWFIVIVLGVLSLGLVLLFVAGVFLAIAVAYHTFFIARNAATPGMSFLDLRVTTTEGGSPDLGQALVTTVLFYLSVFVTVWIVLIIPLLNDKRRTLHDFIAGTLVVRRGAFESIKKA